MNKVDISVDDEENRKSNSKFFNKRRVSGLTAEGK